MPESVTMEAMLQRAAGVTAYPATPALRGSVLRAIGAAPRTRGAQPRYRPVVVFGAVAAALAFLAFGAALAVPTSRSAIAEFFGIEGSTIERLPTPAGSVTPTPFPPAAELPSNAVPAMLAEAEAALGFAPALPAGLGAPEAVYTVAYGDEQVAVLRYPDFDLWQMRPRSISFGKGAAPDVVIRDRTINGVPARWIAGGSHIVEVFDADANSATIPGSERTVARDTLIWRTDHALYRIETTLPEAEAAAIAETLP